MGLEFLNSNARWTYSGFDRFRRQLANAIMVDLDTMDGFGGSIDWATIDSPLVPLLNHSDCEGDLSPEQCGMVASELKRIVSEWPEDDSDRQNGLLLAEGMEECSKLQTPLIFC